MAPKKKRPAPIPGLQNMGTLTDFHTGMIYGLHLAQSLEALSKADIASLMGVTVPTVSNHIEKAEGWLQVAVEELPSPDKARHRPEETEEEKRQLVILNKYTDAEDYEDTLKRYYLNDSDTREHIFMQDGAPPHRARAEWVRSQRQMLEGWPPYSPDLYPIENLWGDLNMSAKVDCFTEIDELEVMI